MSWITDELKRDIRKVFEPRYRKTLSEEEILEIANSLTGFSEALLKFKWKQKYEKPSI